ncbi:MAG TPA: hypothetical protein VGA98_09275 [Allosphingosinicella sp.]
MAAWLAAAGAAALAAGCAGKPAPAPAPTPVARPAPRPPAPVPPPPEPSRQDAPDAPLTPGEWRYADDSSGSAATFGLMEAPVLSVRCDIARRQVSLAVTGASQPLRLQTTYGRRTLPAGGMLAATDPLLDEMVFSRGRFTVEAPGMAALVVPTWPEPARVVEDCRG